MLSSFRNAVAGPSRLALARPTMPGPIPSIAQMPLRQPLITLGGFRTFSASLVMEDKLKSHSGTKKRFFRTGGGLFKRGQAGKRHLNTLFSPGRINRLGRTAYASVTQSKMLKKLLPYA